MTAAHVPGFKPKSPFPFFVADFEKKTLGWSAEERWYYLRLLCCLWANSGAIEDDDAVIAEAMGLNRSRNWREKVEKVRFKLSPHPTLNGFVTQNRLLADIMETAELSQKRSKAAKNLHKQKLSKEGSKSSANGLPPSPSPSLSSLPTKNLPPAVARDDEDSNPITSPGSSTEDRYWALSEKAAAAKIGQGMMGKLINKIAIDPEEALSILEQSLLAREPHKYLGKIVASRDRERKAEAAASNGAPSDEPEIIRDARREGAIVERLQNKETGKPEWKAYGRFYNQQGEEVGW